MNPEGVDCGMWNRPDKQDDGHPHAEDEEKLADSRDAMGVGALGEVPEQFSAQNEGEEKIPEGVERHLAPNSVIRYMQRVCTVDSQAYPI